MLDILLWSIIAYGIIGFLTLVVSFVTADEFNDFPVCLAWAVQWPLWALVLMWKLVRNTRKAHRTAWIKGKRVLL